MNRRNFLKTMAAASAGVLGLPRRFQDAQVYLFPPTVQHVTETTASVAFWLRNPAQSGLVRVFLGEDVVQEVPLSMGVPNQMLTISGLEPSTTYRYEVVVDDDAALPIHGTDAAWDNLSFRTPPFEWPLRVVAVGDSGFGDTATYQIGVMMAAEQADLFFHLGDVVYWMHEYENDHHLNWMNKYFLPFQGLMQRMPHYPTFGNHDQDRATWLNNLPSYYWVYPPISNDVETNQYGQPVRSFYSLDFNGIQFLSLNTQTFYTYRGAWNEQLGWLDEKLARTDVAYTVVFCHIPPFTSSAPHQWDGIYAAEVWEARFKNNNVPLVMSGHAHVYERLFRSDTNYLIAGTGSNTLYGLGERLPSSQNFQVMPAYLAFEFYPDRIHLRARGVNRDTGEIEVLDDMDLPMPGSA